MEPTLSWKPAGTRSEIQVDDYRQMSDQRKLTMKSKERIVERVVRDEDEQSEDIDVSTIILPLRIIWNQKLPTPSSIAAGNPYYICNL